MTAANNALWSCVRRKLKEARLALVGRAWRLTLVLDCGHETAQDFTFPRFNDGRLSRAASDHARTRATRAQTAVRAAGIHPCIACGEDPA